MRKEPKEKTRALPTLQIESFMLTIRGQRVILDSELARLYGVATRRLNEQVKRNSARFPEDFAFRLNSQDVENLRSQIATSSSHGGRRYLPLVFTEHGAIMAANLINSAHQKIRPLLLPPPAPRKRGIGFEVKERRSVYTAGGRGGGRITQKN